MPKIASLLLKILAVQGGLVYSLLLIGFVVGDAPAYERAIVLMLGGLICFWIVLGGWWMRRYRTRFVAWAQRLPFGWRTRFVVLATGLALIEEMVTTAMSNLGPAFGSADAMITASRNYLEVVALNSVIVFIPMFGAWGWLLKRYAFTPVEVMLLFGLTGTLAESIAFGPTQLLGVGIWVYVYGLMVYLPAHSVPVERAAQPVRPRHWLLAIGAGIGAAVLFVPVVLGLRALVGG